MSSFVFPFTTCETPLGGGGGSTPMIQQPWSTAVNLILFAVLLVVALTHCNMFPAKLVLGTYAIFELWHAVSHAVHIPGQFQTNVVHILGYAMSAATLFAIIRLTDKKQEIAIYFWFVLGLAVAVDLYLFFKVKGLASVFSGLAILAVVFFGCLPILPEWVLGFCPYFAAGLIAIGLLFVNETYNCERMMAEWRAPYHMIIEVVGLAMFSMLAYIFVRLEK